MYSNFFKRPLDFTLALIAIIMLSPIILIVAILVRFKLGSPVLFKQARPGLNEKIFMMYKFRTMTDERDKNGNLLPNDQRHTRFGKLLRSTSLDELPGLFNIIKGDMSVIGPRPLLVEYLPLNNGLGPITDIRSEEHTSELQSRGHLVCRLLLEKKKKITTLR